MSYLIAPKTFLFVKGSIFTLNGENLVGLFIWILITKTKQNFKLLKDSF